MPIYCQEPIYFYCVSQGSFYRWFRPHTMWLCQFYCQETAFFLFLYRVSQQSFYRWFQPRTVWHDVQCQFYCQEPTFFFYRWFGPRCDVAMPVLLSRTNLFIADSGHGAMWQCQFYSQEPIFLSLVRATERCGNANFTVKNQPFYRWFGPRCDVAMPVLLSTTNLFITGSGQIQCASQVWGNADFTVARTNNVIADSGHVRCGNASFTTVERDRRVTMAR